MDNYKQLYEKTNEEYKEFYPLTDILSIIDKESGKNLKQLLNQYNHIKLDWKGNTVGTRNSVPLILRHKGLFITYDTGSNIVTEYYTGDDISASINAIWQNDNNWTNFTVAAGLADQEDITEVNGKFKFADRNYNVAQFIGMGRVILRKNLVDVGEGTVKNVLTQDMINKSNTIYEIRYDFDLNGAEITILEGCVLDFQGGSFSNGNIVGNNTTICGNLTYSIFNDSFIKNFILEYIDIRWFGAKEGKDCSDALQRAINVYDTMILTPIRIIGHYLLNKTVTAVNGLIIDNNVPNTRFRDDRLYEGHSVRQLGKLTVGEPITAINIERHKTVATEPAQEAVFSIIGLYVESTNSEAIFIRYRCGGWPSNNFILQHNTFEGFDKVLYFAGGDASNNSQAFAMTIDHCGFNKNNYAIYTLNDDPNIADASFTNMTISNCRINNGSKLYIKGLYGSNTIKDTTVEGTTISDDQLNNPIIYLGVRTGNITFENMYLENIDGYIYIEGTNKTFTTFYSEVNFKGNYYMWDSYANPKLKYYLKDIRISSIHYNLPNKNLMLENVSIDSVNLERTAYNAIGNSNITIDGVENNSILLTGNNYKVVGLDEWNLRGDGGKNLFAGAFKKAMDSVISYANDIIGYKFSGNAEITLPFVSVEGENILEAGYYIFSFYKGDGLLTVDLYDGDTLVLSKRSQFAHGVFLFKVHLEQPITNPIIKVKHDSKLVSFSYMTPIGVIPTFSNSLETQYLSDFNIILGNNTALSNIRYGSYSTIPQFNENVKLASYFDTYHQKPVYFYSGHWRFADGVRATSNYSGKFSAKPETAPKGFAYLCTDKQTTEGGTNGIMIYYKGDGIWVDALGRVIE